MSGDINRFAHFYYNFIHRREKRTDLFSLLRDEEEERSRYQEEEEKNLNTRSKVSECEERRNGYNNGTNNALCIELGLPLHALLEPSPPSCGMGALDGGAPFSRLVGGCYPGRDVIHLLHPE